MKQLLFLFLVCVVICTLKRNNTHLLTSAIFYFRLNHHSAFGGLSKELICFTEFQRLLEHFSDQPRGLISSAEKIVLFNLCYCDTRQVFDFTAACSKFVVSIHVMQPFIFSRWFTCCGVYSRVPPSFIIKLWVERYSFLKGEPFVHVLVPQT